MEKRMVVTIDDFKRLNSLLQFSQFKTKAPLIVDRLRNDLKKAKMLPQGNISRNIVTMNSRVLVTDLASGRQLEVTITYPHDADNLERKVSVFSPIGVALFGRKQGDIASWKIPGGWGEFRIESVTYQPEAAGHYYL